MTYATVGTVGPAPLLWCLVDLDVLDDQVLGVQTLGVGVGLGVLEEREQELSALYGPAGLGDTELLAFKQHHHQYPYSTISPSMHPRTWLGKIQCLTYLAQYGQCSRHISSSARPRRAR